MVKQWIEVFLMKNILNKENNSMEDIQSRVRNLFVNNLEEFKEQLIKDLIKLGISYVQIDNEFHFSDKIYRFYYKMEVKKILCTIENVEFTDKKVVKIASHKIMNKQLIKRDNRTCNKKLNSSGFNKRSFKKYSK